MIENFQVDPQDLTEYSQQVDRNAGYVRQVHSYLANHGSKTDEMQGLLSGLVSGYMPVLEWQLGILQSMTNKLPRTADALHATASTYKRIDEDAAERIDATYQKASKQN